MLDSRANSIEYQAIRELVSQTDALILKKRNGKSSKAKWRNLIEAARYLDIVGLKNNMLEEDLSQLTYIYECLISKLEIGTLPANPGTSVITIPNIGAGIPGPPGQDGEDGSQGPAGLATDFLASGFVVATSVDEFDIVDSPGARWDYVAYSSLGAKRVGTVLGNWNDAGTSIEYNDLSTLDIDGSTVPLALSVTHVGGVIRLTATPASGTWTVRGSRYFIPNNGDGTGPVSAVLANGHIYIGNASSVASPQTVSGVISMSATGVTSLNSAVITDTHIAPGAAIAVDKLAPLTPSQIVVTDIAGVLTTSSLDLSTVMTSSASLLSNSVLLSAGSRAVQTDSAFHFNPATNVLTVNQIQMSTNVIAGIGGLTLSTSGLPITSLVRHDFTPNSVSAGVRLGTYAGDPATLGDSDVWYNSSTHKVRARVNGASVSLLTSVDAALYVLKAGDSMTGALTSTSTAEFIGGARTLSSGSYHGFKAIDIGDWNMDTTPSVTVAHGFLSSSWKNIREIYVVIRDDADSVYRTLSNTRADNTFILAGDVESWDSGGIILSRRSGGVFDSATYDSTGFNRGWIYITYQA